MKIPRIKKPAFTTHLPEAFTLDGFRAVIGKLARTVGRKVLSSALTLYFCFRDSETPAWAKSVIIGALGYLVFPMDFIPDAILGAGFTDDWSVILGALAAVVAHVKDEHREKAAAMAGRLLGSDNTGQSGLALEQI